MKPKLMCSCHHVAAHYGKEWKSHHIMFETTSKNGVNCDFCGYVVYKDYGVEKVANIVNHVSEQQRGKYGRKKENSISEWHKIDKS